MPESEEAKRRRDSVNSNCSEGIRGRRGEPTKRRFSMGVNAVEEAMKSRAREPSLGEYPHINPHRFESERSRTSGRFSSTEGLGSQKARDSNIIASRDSDHSEGRGSERNSKTIKSDVFRSKTHMMIHATDEVEMDPWGDTREEQFVQVCTAIAKSTSFEYAIGIVILINSVLIGVEADMEHNSSVPQWLLNLEHVFLVIYLFELFVRVVAFGWQNLNIQEPDGVWFMFDAFLVFIGCSFTWFLSKLLEGGGGPLELLLLLRTFRVFRLLRALRRVPILRDAWRLVYGLITSTRTMLSTVALLVLMIYMFACLGMELITKDPSLHDGADFDDNFGSIGCIMLTLTQFVTQDSIASIYTPLIKKKPLLLIYFIPLLIIISVALMNLVTAALVEGALAHANSDQGEKRSDMIQRVKELLPTFENLFDSIDVDGDGSIALTELEDMSFDKCPEFNGAIRFDSPLEFFEILDEDDSGQIEKDEFVEGLVNLWFAQRDQVSEETFLMLKIMRVMKRRLETIQDVVLKKPDRNEKPEAKN